MEIQGYRFIDNSLDTNGKTRKTVVTIYNNDNGKYCTITHGKAFKGFDAVKITDKANEILVRIALDKANLDSSMEQIQFDEKVTLTVIETLKYI